MHTVLYNINSFSESEIYQTEHNVAKHYLEKTGKFFKSNVCTYLLRITSKIEI